MCEELDKTLKKGVCALNVNKLASVTTRNRHCYTVYDETIRWRHYMLACVQILLRKELLIGATSRQCTGY
jgi:hypothetical protein